MSTTTGSDLSQLAKRVYLLATKSIEEKTQILQFLKEEGDPSLVEADLNDSTFFLGFRPDPLVDLRASSTIRVEARKEPVLPDLREKCIESCKKLTLFNQLARNEKLTLLIWFKYPWMKEGEWTQIVWYNYFTDMVSIRFDDGGFKVVPRKELFQ